MKNELNQITNQSIDSNPEKLYVPTTMYRETTKSRTSHAGEVIQFFGIFTTQMNLSNIPVPHQRCLSPRNPQLDGKRLTEVTSIWPPVHMDMSMAGPLSITLGSNIQAAVTSSPIGRNLDLKYEK